MDFKSWLDSSPFNEVTRICGKVAVNYRPDDLYIRYVEYCEQTPYPHYHVLTQHYDVYVQESKDGPFSPVKSTCVPLGKEFSLLTSQLSIHPADKLSNSGKMGVLNSMQSIHMSSRYTQNPVTQFNDYLQVIFPGPEITKQFQVNVVDSGPNIREYKIYSTPALHYVMLSKLARANPFWQRPTKCLNMRLSPI